MAAHEPERLCTTTRISAPEHQTQLPEGFLMPAVRPAADTEGRSRKASLEKRARSWAGERRRRYGEARLRSGSCAEALDRGCCSGHGAMRSVDPAISAAPGRRPPGRLLTGVRATETFILRSLQPLGSVSRSAACAGWRNCLWLADAPLYFQSRSDGDQCVRPLISGLRPGALRMRAELSN